MQSFSLTEAADALGVKWPRIEQAIKSGYLECRLLGDCQSPFEQCVISRSQLFLFALNFDFRTDWFTGGAA